MHPTSNSKQPELNAQKIKMRWRVGLGAAILAASGIGFWGATTPEPEYQGKTVSVWLNEFNPGIDSHWAREAMRQLGLSATPYIFAKLRKPNPLTSKYQLLRAKAPQVLQEMLPQPQAPFEEVAGVNALRAIGPDVIPTLARALKDKDTKVKATCCWALSSFAQNGSDTSMALPALVECLKDKDALVRQQAAGAIGNMGTVDDSAIQGLIELLSDNDRGEEPGSYVYVRAWAATALGQIGPPAKAASPALKKLLNETANYEKLPLTQSQGELYARQATATALWRIEHDATTVPVLIDFLMKGDEEIKPIVMRNLGAMGAIAKESLPALYEQATNSNPFVKSAAQNAIKKIREE